MIFRPILYLVISVLVNVNVVFIKRIGINIQTHWVMFNNIFICINKIIIYIIIVIIRFVYNMFYIIIIKMYR